MSNYITIPARLVTVGNELRYGLHHEQGSLVTATDRTVPLRTLITCANGTVHHYDGLRTPSARITSAK